MSYMPFVSSNKHTAGEATTVVMIAVRRESEDRSRWRRGSDVPSQQRSWRPHQGTVPRPESTAVWPHSAVTHHDMHTHHMLSQCHYYCHYTLSLSLGCHTSWHAYTSYAVTVSLLRSLYTVTVTRLSHIMTCIHIICCHSVTITVIIHCHCHTPRHAYTTYAAIVSELLSLHAAIVTWLSHAMTCIHIIRCHSVTITLIIYCHCHLAVTHRTHVPCHHLSLLLEIWFLTLVLILTITLTLWCQTN